MSQKPEFSLDRNYSIENNIDPQGRTWLIHSSKQYPGLVWGRPNPDRSDAQIPKQFEGKWTSKDRLQRQINVYLIAAWDQAEAAQARTQRAKQAAKENPVVEEVVVKKTAEESLAELPDEVKDLLGDTIAVEEKPKRKKRSTKR